MTPRLADLTLRHVDPSKLLLERTDISGAVPEWFNDASAGAFQCLGWHGGTVLATMETKFQHQLYVASVGVAGLFATDEQIKLRSREGQKDDAILKESTEAEMSAFATRAVGDLYPFLRQELYMLTGRFQGVVGVMLQPQPVLARPMETIAEPDAEGPVLDS